MTIVIILIILAALLSAALITSACIMSGHISREDNKDGDNPYNVW